MNDTDRLAAALETVLYFPVVGIKRLMTHEDTAAAILASDPTLICPDPDAHDPAIARQAAIGVEVERLLRSDYGGDFRIEPVWNDDEEGGYRVTLVPGMSAFAKTLDAAIAAALGEDDE